MFRVKGGWVGMVCGEERREAKGRPISTRRGEAAPYLASRASGAAIHSNVHVSLSAKIGDGRHICSRREQRGPYSPIERRAANVLPFMFN